MARTRPSPAGFTLLELAIALAIAALLATLGTPAYSDMVARHRLQAVVENLRADIALARREAGARAQTVRIGFVPGADWCYVLTTGPTTDCHGVANTDSATIKRVRGGDSPGVRLVLAQTMLLDSRNGGAQGTEALARFALADGRELQLHLGPLGLASICASGTPIAKVPACRDPTGRN
jgi:prepilin-type N-terminal cleavage/methylation domain-containing protein